jgi:hypothetical protein
MVPGFNPLRTQLRNCPVLAVLLFSLLSPTTT